jgi:hypothetical protein
VNLEILDMIPEEINGSRIQMTCQECKFTSPLYLHKCPNCHAILMPLELLKYLEFKNLMKESGGFDQLELEFTELLKHEIFRPNVSQVQELSNFWFYISYFKHCLHEFFAKVYSSFYSTLKTMLELNFLHLFHALLRKEIPEILAILDRSKKQLDRLRKVTSNIKYYYTDEVFYLLKFMIAYFSERSFHNNEDSEGHVLLNYVALGAMTELHEKLLELNSTRSTGEEGLEKLKEEVMHFVFQADDHFLFLPNHSVEMIHSSDFKQLVVARDLDCLFLPHHDKYALVKRGYTPDMSIIESLIKEAGGLSIEKVAEKFGVSTLTSELFIQILVRRKMVIKTYSYLHGEKFYLRE